MKPNTNLLQNCLFLIQLYVQEPEEIVHILLVSISDEQAEMT
jgi:hypothetical protein